MPTKIRQFPACITPDSFHNLRSCEHNGRAAGDRGTTRFGRKQGPPRNARSLPASKEVATPRNADILSAPKAGGTPRNAGILLAPKAVVTTRNADILSAPKAGGTPAVQIRNAGILPAPIATPAKLQSSRRNPLLKRGWHSRGYLPHGDPGNRPIHLVLRLYDSLPKHLLARWEEELRGGAPDREDQRRQRIEAALDQGIGACWLKQPNVARIVADALNHFNGDRYTLHAWVIMPNHVHALTTPAAAVTLSSIMHSWKSFTAKQANGLLERTGQFWMEETYDRVMRNRKEVIATKAYIEQNPVVAGLCDAAVHWPWSSACTMAAETTSNAGILPATNATTGNADILSAPNATQAPTARNSSSAATSRRAKMNQRANP